MLVAKELPRLQTTTTATSLATGAVGWSWGDILDTANLHAGTGKGTESGLSTWTWGLGSVTCKELMLVFIAAVWEMLECVLTSGSTDLDVESSDAQFLAAGSNILSSQHSSVWGRLVTIGLDLHSTGNTADGFAATGITQKVSLWTSSFQKWAIYEIITPNSLLSNSAGGVRTKDQWRERRYRWKMRKYGRHRKRVHLHSGVSNLYQIPPGIKNCLPSLIEGPRLMFSCAGRAAFFGGMLTVSCWRIDRRRFQKYQRFSKCIGRDSNSKIWRVCAR